MSKTQDEILLLRLYRDDLLQDAAAWSNDALQYRPRVGQWSALEVLDHLARIERWATKQMRERTVSTNPVHMTRSTFSQVLVFTVMRSPMRVAIPRGAEALHPSTPPTFRHAATAWKDAGLELERVVMNLREDQQDVAMLQHPLAGWMTPPTAVRFLGLHLRHHLRQWDRLRKVAV
jgi:hypothetical protein